jgi:cytochrome c-type biogenesis protein CcmH/NrfG
VSAAKPEQPKRTGLFIGVGVVAIALAAAVVMFTRGGSETPPQPKPAPVEQVTPPAPEAKAPEAKAPETKAPEAKAPETKAPEAQPEQKAETPKPAEQPTVAAAGTPTAEPEEKDEPEQPAAPQKSPEEQYADLVRTAKRLAAGGKHKTAALSFRKALNLKQDSVEAKVGLGISLVRSDSSYREASKLLEDALKDQPNNAQGWLCLGIARQMTQQDKKAVDAYKRYLTLEPTGSSANEVRETLKTLGQ